jgi:hypothetical protein
MTAARYTNTINTSARCSLIKQQFQAKLMEKQKPGVTTGLPLSFTPSFLLVYGIV